MPAFITLVNFTDQGARTIKQSPERYEAFKSMAEGAGVTVKSVHWTSGAYDLVLVTEGAEEAVMPLLMQMATQGNIRTQTLRGYTPAEMRKFAGQIK